MECIEARALKSSFYSEIDMKPSQQVLFEDLWCMDGINSVSSDDFSVDDLLDFSDKDFKEGSLEEFEGDEEEKDSLSVSSQEENSNSTTFSVSSDFGSLSSGDLPVPLDDIENLEWLSQFVDDSVSELSLLCPSGIYKGKTGRFSENRSEAEIKDVPVPLVSSPVPSKARSKRARPRFSGWVWSWSVGSPSLTESSSTSSSSSYNSSPNYPFVWTNPVEFADSFRTFSKPPAKKQKKTPEVETKNGLGQGQRRCSHCQVQKTPQWRTGPLGAKSLCNACGVRYKSGRLFPEYRPACSPTFSGDIHSNSHLKVLEMRRKKDVEVTGVTDSTVSTV